MLPLRTDPGLPIASGHPEHHFAQDAYFPGESVTSDAVRSTVAEKELERRNGLLHRARAFIIGHKTIWLNCPKQQLLLYTLFALFY